MLSTASFTSPHPHTKHTVSGARIVTVLGDRSSYAESGSAELSQRSCSEPEFRKDMNSISTKNCIHAVSSHSHDNGTHCSFRWHMLDKAAAVQPSTSVKYTPTTCSDSSSTTNNQCFAACSRVWSAVAILRCCKSHLGQSNCPRMSKAKGVVYSLFLETSSVKPLFTVQPDTQYVTILSY